MTKSQNRSQAKLPLKTRRPAQQSQVDSRKIHLARLCAFEGGVPWCSPKQMRFVFHIRVPKGSQSEVSSRSGCRPRRSWPAYRCSRHYHNCMRPCRKPGTYLSSQCRSHTEDLRAPGRGSDPELAGGRRSRGWRTRVPSRCRRCRWANSRFWPCKCTRRRPTSRPTSS